MPEDASNDGRGGYAPPYQPEEILAVFEERDDPAEPLTAKEIADANGRSRDATLRHAKKLARNGILRMKKPHLRACVFWLPLDSILDTRGEHSG